MLLALVPVIADEDVLVPGLVEAVLDKSAMDLTVGLCCDLAPHQ